MNRMEEMLMKYPGSLSLHVSFSCPVCEGRETFKVTNGNMHAGHCLHACVSVFLRAALLSCF